MIGVFMGFKKNVLLDVLISVCAVAIGAVAGVIATLIIQDEQKISFLGRTLEFGGLEKAIIVLMILGMLLIVLLRVKTKELISWGTAYYLGALDVGMRDAHQINFKKLKEGSPYQDARAIIYKLDPVGEYGYDWASDIENIAYRVQESMNQDDMSTGFTIFPNMLMPAAIGIGSYLYFPHDVEFVEAPAMMKDGSGEFNKWPKWQLEEPEELVKRVDVLFDKGSRSLATCNGCLALSSIFDGFFFTRILTKKYNSPFELTAEKLCNNGVVAISLQIGDKLTLSEGLKVAYHFSMKPKQGISEVRIPDPTFFRDRLIKMSRKEKDENPSIIETDAETILIDCLYLMAFVERVFMEKIETGKMVPIVLFARLPKTITIALGQCLDLLNTLSSEGKEFKNRFSYWENLIIMNWEPSNTWRITRVHPAQKPLKEMYEALSRFGYSV